MDEPAEQICNGKIAIMKGREDMFKLLQNEYEEYFKELELIQHQYNQEEAYYFIINKLIRDSINDEDISVRDVHKLIRAKDFPGRNRYLRGYDEQVPDFVILHNDFNEKKDEKAENQSGKVYGCVEIKPFLKGNKRLYNEYICQIKELFGLKKDESKLVCKSELFYKKLLQYTVPKVNENSLFDKEQDVDVYWDNQKVGQLVHWNNSMLLRMNESIKLENSEKIKQMKIRVENGKVEIASPRDTKGNECEYSIKSAFYPSFLQNGINNDNKIVCQLLKELIGFKKVIFTNGYQWTLMQCQCDNKNSEDKKITVNNFQCKPLANFSPEPENAELQQHNFEQWLHLKLEINRIFQEAKSQSQQGEEKIENDE